MPVNMSGTPQGILKARGSQKRARSTSGRRPSVYFKPPPNLDKILQNNSIRELEEFITHMKNQNGESLIAWIEILTENISSLDPKWENFVLAVLDIPWTLEKPEVVRAYNRFLANLITAHTHYVEPVILMLVRNLCYRNGLRSEHPPSAEALPVLHATLREMLRVVPFGGKVTLLDKCKQCLPYMLTPHEKVHTNYIECLLHMNTYLDIEDRTVLTRMVIDRLVHLDAYVPKAATQMSAEEAEDKTDVVGPARSQSTDPSAPSKTQSNAQKHLIFARLNLDRAMVKLFEYISVRVEQGNENELYMELMNAFGSFILPSYATGHVQYVMFKFLELCPSYTGQFLDWLWTRFINPNEARILRQNAMTFIASLIARAKYIDLGTAVTCMSQVCDWLHAYMANKKANRGGTVAHLDILAHGPFYAGCQCTFYILAFRQAEIIEEEAKYLSAIRKFYLNAIVASPLNPLRVIVPSVCQEFSRIAKHLQLAYCDAIIERNKHQGLPVVGSLTALGTIGTSSGLEKPQVLDAYFPFDPYTLEASKHFVESQYRDYLPAEFTGHSSSSSSESEMSDDDGDNDDDELSTSLVPALKFDKELAMFDVSCE